MTNRVEVYHKGGDDFTGEVVATRPVCEAYIVPTALVLKQDKGRDGGRWRLFFCAERKNGRYEWLAFCDGSRSFESEALAREFAATWH